MYIIWNDLKIYHWELEEKKTMSYWYKYIFKDCIWTFTEAFETEEEAIKYRDDLLKEEKENEIRLNENKISKNKRDILQILLKINPLRKWGYSLKKDLEKIQNLKENIRKFENNLTFLLK